MTRANRLARILVIITAAGLGLAFSGVGVSRGQTPAGEQAQGTAAASGPTTSSADGLAALERNPGLVSPEEKALQARLEEADRAFRRARLNVREAQIKLEMQQAEFDRRKQRMSQHAVSSAEVDQAKLDVELAQVQVERAQIGLDEAQAATVPVREIHVFARDGQKQFTDQYSVPNGPPTVKQFLQQHFPDALSDKWDVSLSRDSELGLRPVFTGVLDLKASPFASERLQANDWIFVRRNIVRVLSGPGFDSQVLWEGPLSGKPTTVRQILELAKVKIDDHDHRQLLLAGYRLQSDIVHDAHPTATFNPDKTWTASLASIAGGLGKSEQVEPSDTIVLDWP